MAKGIKLLIFLTICTVQVSIAQVGSHSVYNFLDFSYSSRVAALGGNLISVFDHDPSLMINNPTTINPQNNNSLSLNFTDYFTDVLYASALYSTTFKKAGSFAFEIRYIGYGNFTETDASGMEIGQFSVGDYALTAGWGRQLDSNFSIGANMKLVFCDYAEYNSFGIAADVAGTYHNAKKRLALTLLVKNIGSQIKPFTAGNYERIPFDIQLAFSQRFEHLPVRYHISLHSLYRWNMSYYGENNPFLEVDAITGELNYPSKTSQFFDNFFRHLILGLEIVPSKYFSLMLSYNHNRHQEMKIPQKNSFAGFSYGFMVNIQAFRVGFSRAHYAVGAVPNYFTFSIDIDALTKASNEKKSKKLERLN